MSAYNFKVKGNETLKLDAPLG